MTKIIVDFWSCKMNFLCIFCTLLFMMKRNYECTEFSQWARIKLQCFHCWKSKSLWFAIAFKSSTEICVIGYNAQSCKKNKTKKKTIWCNVHSPKCNSANWHFSLIFTFHFNRNRFDFCRSNFCPLILNVWGNFVHFGAIFATSPRYSFIAAWFGSWLVTLNSHEKIKITQSLNAQS